jgi:hypothetical protein
MNNINELERLNFEDSLWIIFATLCIINIYGDKLQKDYIKTNFNTYEKNLMKYLYLL